MKAFLERLIRLLGVVAALNLLGCNVMLPAQPAGATSTQSSPSTTASTQSTKSNLSGEISTATHYNVDAIGTVLSCPGCGANPCGMEFCMIVVQEKHAQNEQIYVSYIDFEGTQRGFDAVLQDGKLVMTPPAGGIASFDGFKILRYDTGEWVPVQPGSPSP